MPRPPLLAVAGYLALAAIILWPAGLGGDLLSACGPFVHDGPFDESLRRAPLSGTLQLSDAMQQFEPWLRYAAHAFERTGRLPLWKDSHSCGAPLLGNAQSALLWPPNLVAIVLGAEGALAAWIAMVKFAVAGLGTFLLARHLGVSGLGAFLAGAAFAFGGFQVFCLLHPHSNVSALLPWLLLCIDRAALQPTGRRAAAVALVSGLQHLGGHPETTFHCQVLAAGLVLARAASTHHGIARALASRSLLWPAGGLMLGATVAAVQIVPFVEYLLLSDVLLQRSQTPATAIVPSVEALLVPVGLAATIVYARRLADEGRRALPAALGLFAACTALFVTARRDGLDYDPILLLAPDWFGAADDYRGFGNFPLANSAYAGAAVALAILGLVAGKPRGISRTAGIVLLIGALVGSAVPIAAGLVEHVPGFHVSANARLHLYTSLSVAVLAGMGLDVLGPEVRPGLWKPRYAGATAAFVSAAFVAFVVSIGRGQQQTSEIAAAVRRASPLAAGTVEASAAAATAGLVGGWVAPTSPCRTALLLFGRARSAPLELLPLGPAQRARLPEVARAASWIYAFRSVLGTELPRRTPFRILCVTDDGASFLSPWLGTQSAGPHWLMRAAAPEGAKSILELGAFATAALLAWALGTAGTTPATRGVGRAALVGLVLSSLVVFAFDFPPSVSPERFYPPSPLLDELRSLRPDARCLVLSEPSLQMHPETGASYGLLEPTGYDAMGPLRSARLVRAACGDETDPRDVDRRVLGIMGVRAFAHSTRLPVEGDTLARFAADQVVTLNDRWLPRARVVSRAEVEPDDERALRRLRDPSFDAVGTVLLSEPSLDATAASEPSEGGTDDPSAVRFLVDEPDRIRLQVPSTGGYLVLADTYYPGWRAFVGDEERPVLRANFAFRAVPLQPTDEVVSLEYRPFSVRAGLAVSLISVLLLAVLARGAGSGRADARGASGAE